MNRPVRCLAAAIALASGGVCAAQSLFLRNDPAPLDRHGKPDLSAPLRQASLFYIEPPRPRTYQVHDLVTIIIDEQSKASSKQTLDTKKDYTLKGQLDDFPSLKKLLELQLENGDTQNDPKLGLSSNQKYKGEGTYDRTDRFNARVSATVIDVKPNGVLVLEARRSKTTDDEVQTIVLNGQCRAEDITSANTVLSSQLADLTLASRNEGSVRDSASKGWIPRVLEAIFNF